MASHRIPMTIYFNSCGCRVLPVLHEYVIILKVMLCQSRVTKCVHGELNWLDNIFLYAKRYNCITQKFHDHYFNSCGCRVVPVLQEYIPNNHQSDVLSDHGNPLRLWWAELIRFHPFICRTLQWHHTESPWLFISMVVVAGSCQFCTDIYRIFLKVVLYQIWVAHCVSGELNWSDSILLYVSHYNGITRKPHDHLSQ